MATTQSSSEDSNLMGITGRKKGRQMRRGGGSVTLDSAVTGRRQDKLRPITRDIVLVLYRDDSLHSEVHSNGGYSWYGKIHHQRQPHCFQHLRSTSTLRPYSSHSTLYSLDYFSFNTPYYHTGESSISTHGPDWVLPTQSTAAPAVRSQTLASSHHVTSLRVSVIS